MEDYKTSEDKEALIAYAKELGMNFDGRFSLMKLREKIHIKLHPEDNIADIHANLKRVTINIHKQEGSTGSSDVQVSVNGKVFLIKRGVDVAVPVSVVEVLKNAVRTEYRFVGEGEDLEANDVLSYPFSMVS